MPNGTPIDAPVVPRWRTAWNDKLRDYVQDRLPGKNATPAASSLPVPRSLDRPPPRPTC